MAKNWSDTPYENAVREHAEAESLRDLARRLAEAIRDFRLNTTEQTSYRLDGVLAEARAAGVLAGVTQDGAG